MKFVFSECMSIKWNGHTARNIKGVSGTHTASMYLAEGLAALNHEVIYVNVNNNIIPTTYLGVKYINYNDFEPTDCDYVIMTYFVAELFILNKITNFKKIIMVMHNPYDIYTNLITENVIYKLDPNKVIVAFISEFSKKNILLEKDSEFLKYYQHILLHNSIDINDIKPIEEKENSFIYFACIGRGYKLAVEIINKFNNNFKLYTNTYDDVNKNSIYYDNIVITEDTSKNTTLNYCVKGKYFVYPLINLDDNIIHCDTFAYVVLEALLHGVVVIAPKTDLFLELYGDAICYIDVDDIMPKLYFNIKVEQMGYPIIDRYIEKLNLLENNVELYNSYVEKGLSLKEKYSNKTIVNTLLDNIDKLKDVYIDININKILNVTNTNTNNKLLHNRLNKYK